MHLVLHASLIGNNMDEDTLTYMALEDMRIPIIFDIGVHSL